MNASDIKIFYKNGRWGASCNRWVLAAESNCFYRLESLLAELAAMGVRACGGLTWEDLPAANEFNKHEFCKAARKYAAMLDGHAVLAMVEQGFWISAVGLLVNNKIDYTFVISSSQSESDMTGLVAAGHSCATIFVPGREPVMAAREYLLEKMLGLSGALRKQLKADRG